MEAVEDVVASMIVVAVEVAEEVAVVALTAVEVDVVVAEVAPTVVALETSKAKSKLLLKLALDGDSTEHTSRARALAPRRP